MTTKSSAGQLDALYSGLLGLYRNSTPLLPDEKLRLAEALDSGNYGLEADPQLAEKLVEEAAQGGHPLAMIELTARAMERDEDLTPETMEWIRRASALGEVESDFTLGIALITGQGGVEIDPEQGWRLIERAAYRSHPEAAFQLAVDYLKGSDRRPQDLIRAKYFELVALNSGSTRAESSINHFFNKSDLVEGGDTIDTRRVVEQAAAAGCAPAELELANALFVEAAPDNGEPDSRVTELLERAANGGAADAMCNLAEVAIAKGDNAAARRWLEMGVAAGHHAAKGLLGKLLAESGDPAEADRAVELLSASLDFGFPPAQQAYAALLKEGRIEDPTGGVRPAFYDALFWESFESDD